MKLIFADAFGIVCKDTMLYFVAKDPANEHDVFYKTDLSETEQISLDEYVHVKFGNAWRSIQSHHAECIHLDSGYLTCDFQSSVVFKHDLEGHTVYQYSIGQVITGFDTVYSIALDQTGKLWVAKPSSHFIGQYSLDNECELFSIGGDFDNPEFLNFPEEIRIYGNYAFISDMGNGRICKLNIETKELSTHLQFAESVWEYGQCQEREIIRLESGIYVI